MGKRSSQGPDLERGHRRVARCSRASKLLGHANGEAVLLARIGDDYLAIGATCTHYGGPLAEGVIDGDTVRCPWHHACFSLRTGEALEAPALSPVACWQVERRGEQGRRHGQGRARPAVADLSRDDAIARGIRATS